MPKKIDPALRDRAIRLVREHRSEYPSLTAASAAVARQVGVGHESVRRWVLQATKETKVISGCGKWCEGGFEAEGLHPAQ